MVLQELSDYIENLCTRHTALLHSDTECHFVNLNNDKKQTHLADEMRYPGVFFEVGGYRLTGVGKDIKQNYTCSLEVWSHVEDTADYTEIESVLSECNGILCDIFAKMITDKVQRTVPILKAISLDGVQVEDITNASNALYGCHAVFTVPANLCIQDRLSNFND